MHCNLGKKFHQNWGKIDFLQLGRYPFLALIVEGKKALSSGNHYFQDKTALQQHLISLRDLDSRMHFVSDLELHSLLIINSQCY